MVRRLSGRRARWGAWVAVGLGGCPAWGEPSPASPRVEVVDRPVCEVEPGTSRVAEADGPLRFARACEPGARVVVAATGDVLLHGTLQQQGLTLGFDGLWEEVAPLLRRADVTYGNLEGPVAGPVNAYGARCADPGPRFDDVAYTSYPMFNYHPSLASALVRAGFDVVSTANNHALDRRSLGVDETLRHVRSAGLAATGTRARGEAAGSTSAFVEAAGLRLAFIACTAETNGIADRGHQVTRCSLDEPALLAEIGRLASDPVVDAVIVTPHWGYEYETRPRPAERAQARRWLDAGATAILGNHPHVLQPLERYRTADGRETLIAYSLGNFVSGQRSLSRNVSAVLYLGLTRGADGETFVHGVGYVPVRVSSAGGGFRVLAADAPGDARRLATGALGDGVAMRSTDPLDLTPQCAW
jgi:poly-gamma-glutamate synthesis protein (capsule biosynthesis protein)